MNHSQVAVEAQFNTVLSQNSITMASSKENFMGPATGKLGSLIIYQRNGKTCYRSKPEKISVPASQLQIYHRKAFALVSRFIAPIRHDLAFGFSGISGDHSKRVGKAISLAVKKAVTSVEGEPRLDPDKIQTSIGDLLMPQGCQVVWTAGNIVQLTWQPNSLEGNGRDSDQVFYLAYDPESQRHWRVINGAYRKNGVMIIEFPWSGSLAGRFHHYVSFYRQRKTLFEFSDSISLGKI
jgi:hypothetical protein